jgi:UMF1 family MFS transporter
MKFKLTKPERSWVLYDVANSAFVMIVASLLPIYYNTLATRQGYSSTDITAIFGTLLSASAFSVALINPVLGAIADNKGMKKKMFSVFLGLGVISCFLIGISNSIPILAAIVIIGRIGLSGSIVFYDAMLIDVSSEDRYDDVSGRGFGWGYVGSTIPFSVCLALYALSTMPKENPILGIGDSTAIVIGMAITGAWWGLVSIPLLRDYRQIHGVEPAPRQIRNAFRKIGETLRDLPKYKAPFMFLLAFFFYIDGVGTIIGMSVVYAQQVLGDIQAIYLVIALLMTQFVAWPFAIIFSSAARKYSPRYLILISIVGYSLVVGYAYFMKALTDFFILAFFVGLFQGGIQALSRSYFAKIIPKHKSNEFFGAYDIFSKGAAVIGPGAIALMTKITNNPRLGILALLIFFIIGGIFLILVPKNDADLPNKELGGKIEAESGESASQPKGFLIAYKDKRKKR